MRNARGTMKVLAILAGVLLISSAIFAGPGQARSTDRSVPTTDGAVWGSGGGAGGDGAVWGNGHGGDGAVWGGQNNSQSGRINTARDTRNSTHGSLGEYMRSLFRNLGILAEGAVWG